MTVTHTPTEAAGTDGPLPGGPLDDLRATATAPLPPDPARRVLASLLDGVAGLRGALVASLDGRPVAAVLPDRDVGSTAAIVAASLGLGGRLADLTGEGRLQEIVVRSASGYVVVYAVEDRGVLTVLTTASANLALLHLRARQACQELAADLHPG